MDRLIPFKFLPPEFVHAVMDGLVRQICERARNQSMGVD